MCEKCDMSLRGWEWGGLTTYDEKNKERGKKKKNARAV